MGSVFLLPPPFPLLLFIPFATIFVNYPHTRTCVKIEKILIIEKPSVKVCFRDNWALVNAGPGEAADGVLVDDDINEPTMGEKLAGLNLVENSTAKSNENDESSVVKPPSADSVHVLLKQALHADDRAILLDCLYTQDEKVYFTS